MYITNNPKIAELADTSGVDWIFIDLEKLGKEDRQKGLDTVKSQHTIEDISRVKDVIRYSELLVRINPVNNNTRNEIEEVIKRGAEIIMLPYFKYAFEVEQFIKMVDGRVKTCLLLETEEAVNAIDSILEVRGIDYIHIGLNDLHLSYGMDFMFEPLKEGIVDNLGNKIKSKNIPFGFGGIAKLGDGALPAENILAEHHRLKSEMVILSRSFITNKESLNKIKKEFIDGINKIRFFEASLKSKSDQFFIDNKNETYKIVDQLSKVRH